MVAVSPYEADMYGEMTPVVGATKTMELNNPERIIWSFNGNQIWTAQEQENGTVTKYCMMKLDLKPGQVIRNMWIFDAFIVVRFTSLQISFFEKPLIKGYTETPMTINFNGVLIGLNYSTFDFGRNNDNQT